MSILKGTIFLALVLFLSDDYVRPDPPENTQIMSLMQYAKLGCFGFSPVL